MGGFAGSGCARIRTTNADHIAPWLRKNGALPLTFSDMLNRRHPAESQEYSQLLSPAGAYSYHNERFCDQIRLQPGNFDADGWELLSA
jgi:hypothetical protein